ncbi:5-oxoprolinase subunit PxpB [Nicoliella spurrieriana]|uniref:5-oxoprolinase subunit PxpB n=1 Tax=Nicoliella spurrieriana TaxID=2925830 RepID=A0A976RRR8_9LACO|nr:5-oxoprolinase subunit PxpB [Nicoliella spurrieriana]UQS86589.1 5-oxoprolinase subunit PxpB [Nicoliella spurrieriana]
MHSFKIIPVGDQALSIVFPDVIDITVNRQIQALVKQINQLNIVGIQSLIPAYHTLMISFDALKVTYLQLRSKLNGLLSTDESLQNAEKRILKIPVCYENPYNPDLQSVAEFAGISPEEVIRMHTQGTYLIYFLGFLPGFAYMASVDKQIAMPRLETPRVKIPAGSVGIAGIQTGFYPVDAPGGWRLIGRTPLKLYNQRKPELFFHSGDFVKFFSISLDEYEKIKLSDQKGEYKVRVVVENG